VCIHHGNNAACLKVHKINFFFKLFFFEIESHKLGREGDFCYRKKKWWDDELLFFCFFSLSSLNINFQHVIQYYLFFV
jgi:hypothetical protein